MRGSALRLGPASSSILCEQPGRYPGKKTPLMTDTSSSPGGMFASHPTSNPATIRFRLVEHAHDPKAWERGLQAALKKAESISEWRVIRHLTNAGYETIPQYSVGAY